MHSCMMTGSLQLMPQTNGKNDTSSLYLQCFMSPTIIACINYDIYLSFIILRVLTGAYDGTLHLWSIKGKHKLGFSAHTGPIKTVGWISTDKTTAVFARL